MFLSFSETVKKIINEMFSKFDLSNLTILFFGIIIGFLLCMAIYIVIVISTLKKSDKIEPIKLDHIENIKIKRVIENAKEEYLELHAKESTGKKVEALGHLSWQIIKDIAKIYYPDSPYPTYELSIDEMIRLNYYITKRIENLFSNRVLRTFTKIKVSQILKLIDLKRKIDENKVVKFAQKTKVPKIYKSVMTVLDIFNPTFWVRKMMISTTIEITTNKIAFIILDVVGDETNKIYSKNQSVFSTEDEISKQIEQMESLLLEENKE